MQGAEGLADRGHRAALVLPPQAMGGSPISSIRPTHSSSSQDAEHGRGGDGEDHARYAEERPHHCDGEEHRDGCPLRSSDQNVLPVPSRSIGSLLTRGAPSLLLRTTSSYGPFAFCGAAP